MVNFVMLPICRLFVPTKCQVRYHTIKLFSFICFANKELLSSKMCTCSNFLIITIVSLCVRAVISSSSLLCLYVHVQQLPHHHHCVSMCTCSNFLFITIVSLCVRAVISSSSLLLSLCAREVISSSSLLCLMCTCSRTILLR